MKEKDYPEKPIPSVFSRFASTIVTGFVAVCFFTLPGWAKNENPYLSAFFGGNAEGFAGNFVPPLVFIVVAFAVMVLLAKLTRERLLPLTSLEVLFVIAGCLLNLVPVLKTVQTGVVITLALLSWFFIFRSFKRSCGLAIGMVLRILGVLACGVAFNASTAIFSMTSDMVSFISVLLLAVMLFCWVRAEVVGEL